MLKDSLKKEIDQLRPEQLRKIADLVVLLKAEAEAQGKTQAFWQRATSKERAQNFREWVSNLSQTNRSLADEAFDRESIYD